MKYLLLMLLFFSSMFASIGKVSAVVGDAKIERGNKNIVVKIGIPLFEKDIIRTKKNAKVQLIFKDNTIVTIGKNSALDINTYLYDKKNPKNSKTDLNFFKGAFKTITGKIGKINREKFKLRTKSASIGIRGTIILGNQTVIACTQGGISVESAGITVDVNANELTKVEENKAPSKAENITNNDLNNLEKSLEPASDTTTKDDETNSNEEDNNSESNNDENSDEKTSEESSDSNSNDDTSDEEDDVSSNTLETDVALNPDVDSAEEEAAKIAAQKQAEELAVYTKKTEEVKKATETINTLKTEVTQTQVETQTVLENLPSTAAVTTYQTNATQTLATANTEVTTAVNNLKDDLGLSSSTQSVQSVQSFFSFSFFSTNSVSAQSSSSIETQSNETSLEKAVELRADAQTKYDEINSFRNSQNIDTNSLALASAKTKVDSAKASLDESLIQLNIANQALSDANSAGISSSYISDIQKNVDEVQAAYDSVEEAYTIANNLYENKIQALKDIETSFKKASNGLDKAKLNVEVIKIKDYLEIIKSSKTNTDTYKHEVVGLKSNIENKINSLTSQSETSTLKTNTDNAKDTTNNSINTAVSQLQSSTTNVVTDDALASIINLFNQTSGNTDLLNESTALKSDIVTSDNLAALNIAKAELKKATTALDNSEIEYNNALKNKKDLRTAFDSVIELENNIKKAKELETDDDLAKELGLNSEVSKLKTSSINKADSDFNEAQTAYNEAQTAHASAQTLYNDKQKAYDEANESYTNAQEAVNDALVLGKLKDLLVKVDESSDSKTNATTNKNTVLNSKTSIENGINSLISQSQTSTLKTNTDNAKTTTDSSINTAVSQLQSSTTNVITDDALANIVSLFNQTSGNTDLLNESTALKSDVVTSENLNALNSANEALSSASTALENTEAQYKKAQNAYTKIQGLFESNGTYNGSISEELKTSLLSKALSDLNSAQSAHSEAQSAYTTAQTLYEDKQNAYDEANESYTNAQEAVNDALVLGKLKDLLVKVDESSDSKTNATTNKNTVLNSKTSIENGINSLISQSQTSTLKTNTDNAKTTTDSSINTAVSQLQSSTTNVITDDALANIVSLFNQTSGNTDLLNESTALKSDVVTSENLNALNSANEALSSASTALENTEAQYKKAQNAYTKIQGLFESNGTYNGSISEELKTSLLSKALSDLNSAQSAHSEAQSAYTSAQALYNDKQKAYDEANESYTNAQEAVNDALVLGKLKDLLVKVDESSDSKTNATTNKNTVLNSKTSIENGINSLISQSQTSTLKTNTDNAKTTTDSSINTAVSQLQSSTTNVITDDALANIVSLFNQTSGNTDLLNESTALKSEVVTSENLNALNSANEALSSASTALENTEAQYKKAQNAYTKIQGLFESNGTYNGSISEELKTSLLSKALSDLNSAQSAHSEAQSAYTSAQALYNDKQKAYDEANESYTNAQEAVNDALVLGKLKDLLVKVDESSDSKTNATTNKNTVLNSKTSIENGINSLISQSQTSTLKTNTDNAKTTTDSSINTAVSQLQSSTTNVITDDALANIVSLFNQTSGNTDLLNESTALKSEVVTSENLNALNSANEALSSASAALQNTQTQYQNAQNAYTEIQDLFESNGTYNGSISEELKTSLLSKALSDLNSAQVAHSQAQSAYTTAQTLYEDKQNAYDEANDSYTNAQEAVNDALVLGKLLDLIKFMDLASDNKSTAVSEKTNTLTFQSQINTIINTLPTDEDLINKDINTETKLENTNTAINSAIAALVGATETSSVAPSELSSLSNSASSTLSNNETLLASAESFKNSVDNEYKNSLDSATVKLNSAKTHRDNSKQALDIAKQALVDFNASFSTNEDNFDSQVSDTLKNSLISKLNSDISQAQSAFDEANTAYNLVENEISTKREDLNISANNSLEQAQAAVSLAQDLGKLSDMLGYIDTANKGNANATVSKTDAINAKNIVLSKISTLPSSTEIQAEENVASSALTTTRTSLTSAINAINTASNSESVNADDVGNVSMSANNLKSSNTAVLANAQTFKTKVTEGEYKTTLDETAVKVAVALSAKQSAETAKNSAHLAMTNMNNILALFTLNESEESGESEISDIVIISNGENSPPPNESESEDGTLSTSSTSIVLTSELIEILQGKLQSEYDSAKEAYDDAEEAYDLAKSDYDNKNASLNNAATSSVSDAQTAVNETNLLEDLSDLLTSLENTKEAKINVLIEKDKLVDAKAQTVSANTNATNANTNILAFKSDAADAKTASMAASTASTSASSTANKEETLDVQIAYSAKIAVDKVALAKNKADQASAAAANANTQYNNLVAFTNTMNNELSKSLTAKDKAYTDYHTALAQLAITKAKKIEIDAVSNTLASQAAVNAVNKAQALYDLALQSYNDANQLYTETKQIVADLNITTYLANAETKKNKASSDAAEAQTAYNTALLEAVKARNSSTQASLRVKNIMLALNTKQVASDTTESNLGLDNKLFELSGVKTNETLIPTAIGAYLGHTQIGVFKEDINSVNPLYLVQADNLQEYFVGYSDSSNSDKTLFTYGVDTNNNFDASKINVYKNFKTLKVNTDGTKVLSNDNTLAYYNPVTKSFTTFSKDVFKDGAKNFTAGDAEIFNTQENTFNFNSNGFTVSSVDITESTGSSKFLGSVEQGLTQTSQNNAITNTSVDGQTASVSTKISDDMSASFLDSQMDVEPLEASRSMSGSVVLLTNSGTAGTTRHENIEMTISNNSKNEVHIIADAKYENGNTIKRYGGYVNDQKAYYINSDIFGVKVEEPTPSEKGFLIAVPDGGYNQANEFVMYDENDNPLTSNDDSSWGYWSGTNSFNDGNGIVSINPLATWVAGVKTSSTYMDALFNGANQNLEFNGKVLGTIGYQDSILMDSTNKVRINFDIGGGSKNMTGNMQFKSATSNLYNVDLAVNSDNITNSSFTGGFKPAGNPDAATTGYIKGEYYGGNTLKSIGGNFQVDQHGATANGVFKATKK